MSVAANPPARILLTRLPAAVAQALLEQWEEAPALHVDVRTGGDAPAAQAPAYDPAYDLVICGDDAPLPLTGGITPGTPRLDIDGHKRHRLGVVLRQARQMLEEPALYLDGFQLGRYFFNPSERQLTTDGQEDIALTDKETDILVYLARHHASAVTRDDLLKNVWRYQQGVDTHTLETHIYRLRQKIEISAETPALLVTEEAGYRLVLAAE
jgi:hypothetical protein